MEFDYSQLDPETAKSLKKKASEINSLMDEAGEAFWKAGIAMIGKTATIEQIANLLSTQFGHEKEFILNAMNRVKRP